MNTNLTLVEVIQALTKWAEEFVTDNHQSDGTWPNFPLALYELGEDQIIEYLVEISPILIEFPLADIESDIIEQLIFKAKHILMNTISNRTVTLDQNAIYHYQLKHC